MARFLRAAKKAGKALVKGSKKLDKAVSKHKWTIASLAAGGPVGVGIKTGVGMAAAKFGGKAAVSAAKKKLPQPDIEKLAQKVADLGRLKPSVPKAPKIPKPNTLTRIAESNAEKIRFAKKFNLRQSQGVKAQKRKPGK